MFADTARTGKDHSYGGRWDVHAFIEDFAGDQYRIGSGAEGIEEFFAFGAFSVVSYYRKREGTADFISAVIVGGEVK